MLEKHHGTALIEAAGLRRTANGMAAPHDECFGQGGLPRPQWTGMIEAIERLGAARLNARWDEGLRIIREHGVTYIVYGDPQGRDRPWSLDPVPLILSAPEWRSLEAGLIQRSRLLNWVLRDLYLGTQRLIADGFIPPELVYSNPGFLRPCRGLPVAGQVMLHLYGADLVRSASGQWMTFADRTQSASGTGYAHENRKVVSRVLPDEIREVSVRSLAPFFRSLRSFLETLAPGRRENPVMVLMTPGPLNATYFEHAYLARHLGIPLVEGADLTVRDLRVCLKTLEGLQPVDVILRRVDDSFCDPLELRTESVLGVPGLVQAARAGHVTIANALGSGLVESPAFLTFLPALCRHLLDEDLLLPSVPTWWCGEAEGLRYVTSHLDRLVVKPAFGRRRGTSSPPPIRPACWNSSPPDPRTSSPKSACSPRRPQCGPPEASSGARYCSGPMWRLTAPSMPYSPVGSRGWRPRWKTHWSRCRAVPEAKTPGSCAQARMTTKNRQRRYRPMRPPTAV